MKLAVVHSYLYTKGGAERVVLKVAKHFNAKIYCSRYEPELTYPEFKELEVEELKTPLQTLVPNSLPVRVRDAIRAGMQMYLTKISEEYDVINAQGTPSEWIRNRNSPVVWYVHTPNREAFDLYEWRMSRRSLGERILYWSAIQPYRIIEAKLVPKIEYLFANSALTQSRVRKYLGRESEILHPGVDYREFYCKDYEHFFFYPSRITPEKRFEYAISAFKQFKKKSGGKEWKLVIAGALVHERPEHVRYYHNIRKLLGDDGEILVDVDFSTFHDLYSRCYSVLYTPVNEDFGIIPLEAGASFKPCIAVNEGGPREVVVDGYTGFLVNSVEEMTEKMLELARNDKQVEEMGKNARKHVEKNFSWERFLKRFEEVCKEVANGAK